MRLRQYYDSVQEQEIPKRFLDLLEKLDEAENAAKGEPDDAKGEADTNERS